MADVRLIDANALYQRIEEWIHEEELDDATRTSMIACTVLDDVLDAIKEAKTFKPTSQPSGWHPASEIPPLTRRSWRDGGETFTFLESAPLLLLLDHDDMKTGWFNRSDAGDVWMDEDGQNYNRRITHWMERPKPPKEVQQNG